MSAGKEQSKDGDGRIQTVRVEGVSKGCDPHPTSNNQHSTSKEKSRRRAAYDLEERLLVYAVKVIRAVDLVPKSRGGDHLGGQLLRSGTSPALNHGEAQAAESLNDFIHKMKICLKKLRESRRTLRIIQAVPLTNGGKDADAVYPLVGETEELIRIFYTAIRTANSRRDPRGRDGDASSRVREDGLAFDHSAAASLESESSEEIDPITGAKSWMLDVGCSKLDVEARASSRRAIRAEVEQEEAQK